MSVISGYQGEPDIMQCPNCGYTYLHQSRVVVYNRSREDADVVCTVVNPSSSPIGATPSSRRDGLAIEFSCEGCGMWNELLIAQHKGETFLSWRRSRWEKEPAPAEEPGRRPVRLVGSLDPRSKDAAS